MNQPLVSVIIPTFNRRELLIHNINSILKQSYINMEIFIIDDGSTDDTKKLTELVKDSRLFYFRKKHGGPASARNFGIKKAKGKYIAFCDDDDRFLSGKLETQVKFLEKTSRLAFCYTNGYVIEKNQKRIFLPKLTQSTFSALLFENSQILTPTVLVRSDVIKSLGGFDESIPYCEDYDLWLRIAQKYSFDFIDSPYVSIYKHAKNISNDTKTFFRHGVIVKLKNLRRFGDNLPKIERERFEWVISYQQGKFYFFENKLKKSRYLFLKAISLKPFSMKPLIFMVFTFLGQRAFDTYFIPFYENIKKKTYLKSWETLD